MDRIMAFLVILFLDFTMLFADSELSRDLDFDELAFTHEPLDAIFLLRDKPIILHCLLQTSTSLEGAAVNVQWMKDGLPLVLNNRRQLLDNGSLLIEGRPDDGDYRCLATVNGIGSILSRSARVQMAYMDKIFSEEPQNVSAGLGDVVMLSCAIGGSPAPVIEWLKDDEPLDPQSLAYYVHSDETDGSVLEIRSAQAADFGRYKCRATSGDKTKYSNVAILTQIAASVNIHEMAPYFVMVPKDRAIREGKDLVLYCGANGRDRKAKRPTIGWLKDGITIDLSSDNERFSLVGEGSLRIERTEEDDSGLYTCRATNSDDATDANALLTVLVPPKLQVVPQKTSGHLNSDQELACVVYGTPRPLVQWYQNGVAIFPDDYVQVVDGHNLRIMGLLSSDEGVYQCMATNGAGSAQAAALLKVIDAREVPPATQDGLPSQPMDLSAVIISTRFVTLSWKQPISNGLTDIAGYVVSWKETGAIRERELNTTALEANIQHLKPSTRYTFEVRAYNSNGYSQNAAQFAIQTQDEAQVPDPPVNPQALPLSSTSVAVTWDNVQSNLSSPITGYKLYYYEFGDEALEKEVAIGVMNSYILSDMKKFQQYSFRVAALNGNGLGMSTEEVVCQTFSDVPSGSPENVSVEVQSSSSVIVRWDPPPHESSNGIVTGYRIRYKQKKDDGRIYSVTTDAGQGMVSLVDLTQGTEYSFSVEAFTRNGSGPASPWVSAHTFAQDLGESTVPLAPSSLRVRPQTNSIVVSWTPPIDQNVLVRGYILGYGVGIPDVYRQILDPKQRYHTIRGLQPSSEYVISLKAFNAAGEGNPVYETTITRDETTPEPLTPIIPPVGLKAIVLSSSAIVLTWSDTTLGRNQRVTDNRFYTIRYTPRVQRKPKLMNSTDLNVHIEDLKPDTEYEFSVKIVKGWRQSTWSLSVLNKTKEAVPGSVPRDVTPAVVENHLNWVSLSWQPPRIPNGQITGYVVFYTTDAKQKDRDWVVEVVLGDRLSVTIKDLSLETTYYFKVQARNNIGYGPTSSTIVFRTPHSDGTGGGPVEMPDDYRRLPKSRGEYPDSLNLQTTVSPSATVNIPTTVLWISIGCIGGFTFVALVIILAIFCHRKQAIDTHNNRQGYMPANKPKPPDLWIHDRMEMKDTNRSEEIDEGTAMMSRESQESKDDTDLGDPNGFDPNDSDRFRRMAQRLKPVMIPVDQPPAPRETYLPAISNGIVDSNTVIVRPVYPRTQYTCQYAGAPRVNAGQIIAPQSSGGTPGRSVHASNAAGHVKPALSPSSHGPGNVTVGGSASRDTAAGSSSLSPTDVAADSKSYSAEELTAEMANLEGLMKDLSAITQHEFEC